MTRFVIEDEHEGHKFEWTATIRPSSSPTPPRITCTECRGSCLGSFKSFEPTDCWRCNNTGMIADPNFKWDPEPPEELVDALHKAWKDYWNKVQNEKFKLE